MEKSKQKFKENQTNYPFLGPETSLNVTREMQWMVNYIVQSELANCNRFWKGNCTN